MVLKRSSAITVFKPRVTADRWQHLPVNPINELQRPYDKSLVTGALPGAEKLGKECTGLVSEARRKHHKRSVFLGSVEPQRTG
jgi:hypothetical protein